MKVYIGFKMDPQIVSVIPNTPEGCIGVLPVFESLQSLQESLGANTKYKEMELPDHSLKVHEDA